MDKNGLFIGNINNFTPVVSPLHEEKNRNAFVIGKTGRGRKMYTMIDEWIKNSDRALVIDPKNELRKE